MKNIKYVNNREILCCGTPVNDDLEESFDSAKDLTQTMINIMNDQITLLKLSGILPNQLNPEPSTSSGGSKQSEIGPHATPNIGNKIPVKEPYNQVDG
ncbi:hypothetical protein JTB14_017150 [Gonioctena quinquepunctata]|nr:hypothetical protein JTB14_017150 [Gonioctena quinquepunctata]